MKRVMLVAALAAAVLSIGQANAETGCTAELVSGGDLSTFLGALAVGDVGCLRGGPHTDGGIVSWSNNDATVQSYPGEQAEIVGTQLQVVGNNLTVKNLTVRDTVYDRSCVGVNGSGATLVGLTLLRCAKHGIILHTDSVSAVVARNIVDGAGVGPGSSLSASQVHGIYVQGPGHSVVRNVFVRMTGYGIHIYSSPSNLLVSGNTAYGSATRYGVIVRTSGSNVVVVNNVFGGGALHTCGGCLIDTNLVSGGWTIQNGSSLGETNTIAADPLLNVEHRPAESSPAVGAARPDTVFPDLAGTTASYAAPDLGAFELTAPVAYSPLCAPTCDEQIAALNAALVVERDRADSYRTILNQIHSLSAPPPANG